MQGPLPASRRKINSARMAYTAAAAGPPPHMSGQTFRPVTSDKQRCEPWHAGRPPLKDNRGRTIRSEKTRTSGRRNTRHETRHPICRVSQSHPITKTHRHLQHQLTVVSPQVSYLLKGGQEVGVWPVGLQQPHWLWQWVQPVDVATCSSTDHFRESTDQLCKALLEIRM